MRPTPAASSDHCAIRPSRFQEMPERFADADRLAVEARRRGAGQGDVEEDAEEGHRVEADDRGQRQVAARMGRGAEVAGEVHEGGGSKPIRSPRPSARSRSSSGPAGITAHAAFVRRQPRAIFPSAGRVAALSLPGLPCSQQSAD